MRDWCYVGRDHLTERSRFRLTVATVVVFAVAGWLMPSAPLPRLAIFAPIFYAIAILGDFTTALILLTSYRAGSASRTTLCLALSFGANAVLLISAVLFLPLLPFSAPILNSRSQFAVWVFLLWHVSVAAGAFAFVIVRRFDRTVLPNTRFVILACAGVVLWIGALVSLAYLYGDRFPLITVGTSTAGFDRFFIGPGVAAMLALATLLVYRLRAPEPVERALVFSLLALTLSFVLFLVSSHRYSAGYYLGRLFVAVGSLTVLVAAMRSLVASRARLGVVEGNLRQVATESAKRAGRIRAVWDICSVAQPTEAEGVNAILSIATAAMRPGKPMLGMLTHEADQTLVVDATAWSDVPEAADIAKLVFPGAVYPVEQTMAIQLKGRGRAYGWDDLSTVPLPDMVYAQNGLRSFIGAAIDGAGSGRFVAFVSTATMTDEPFAEDDLAYVEVISAFFAARLRQEQQFERIKFQIEHDALTGLDNRTQFRTAVRERIAAGVPFTIAFIDLDGFRHINDRYGHQIGDELLVEVAVGLRRVAAGDFAARMSSDEFGVLIPDVGALDASTLSLQRYAELFAAPFPTGDRTGTQLLSVGASIGAARFPSDGNSAEELMRRADLALDVAKERGGSVTMVFDTSMEAMLEANRLRVVELGEGIANDQLAMVYQPTFALATRKITGAEALVRWNHPERGLVEPAEFVGFAEHNGLIAALTMWVFARVTNDIASAPPLPPGFRIYFNVAAPMLDDVPFIAAVNEALSLNPTLAKHLGIEVTESAAMLNIERSMNTVALFRSWGVTVAIDDFGTGHSSLAYLKRLTVDLVKIDRSFISGLPGDERDGQITEMLLRIIDRFGFATLAEGIETEAQADWLLAHGCRYGQGYFIARPRPFAELLDRLGLALPTAAARGHARSRALSKP